MPSLSLLPNFRSQPIFTKSRSLVNDTAIILQLQKKSGKKHETPTNLGEIQFEGEKKMLCYRMGFGEVTVDGLIDTGVLKSAIRNTDFTNSELKHCKHF